jgi:hypothetical protein
VPYQIIDNVAYGSAELEIKEVFEKLPEFFIDLEVVVTYKDSCPAIPADKNAVIEYPFGRPIGAGYLLNPEDVGPFLQLLDGFDEIFLIPKGSLQNFPEVEIFCTPPYFSEDVPPLFIETFKALGAVGFLGDGIGLNYACDPKFAEQIETLPDLETYHLRVLPYKLDRSGPLDPQIIGPIDINKRTISL